MNKYTYLLLQSNAMFFRHSLLKLHMYGFSPKGERQSNILRVQNMYIIIYKSFLTIVYYTILYTMSWLIKTKSNLSVGV